MPLARSKTKKIYQRNEKRLGSKEIDLVWNAPYALIFNEKSYI